MENLLIALLYAGRVEVIVNYLQAERSRHFKKKENFEMEMSLDMNQL